MVYKELLILFEHGSIIIPADYKKLSIEIKKSLPKKKPSEIPETYAKLVSQYYGTIEIIDLDTLEMAREKLSLIEQDFRKDLWEQSQNSSE